MLKWLKDILYNLVILLEKKDIRVKDLPFSPDITSLPNGVVIEHNKKKEVVTKSKKELSKLEYRMPFGKYKGQLIQDITDVQYLQWFSKIRNISKSLRKVVLDRIDFIQMTKENYYASVDSSVYVKLHKRKKR